MSSKSCQGTGRAETASQNPGRGTGQSPFFCQNPGWDMDRKIANIFPMISCFTTSFPFQKILFLFQNILFYFRMSSSCFRTSFFLFFVFFKECHFVQGRPGTSRDIYFCSCPGTRFFLSQDVTSLGKTSLHPPSKKYVYIPEKKCILKFGCTFTFELINLSFR